MTSRPVVDKSEKRTGEIIGETSGESERTVQRYIRLTQLIPELQQFVDEGKIKVNPAVITRVFGISKIPKIFRIQRVNTGRRNGILPQKRHKKVPKAL